MDKTHTDAAFEALKVRDELRRCAALEDGAECIGCRYEDCTNELMRNAADAIDALSDAIVEALKDNMALRAKLAAVLDAADDFAHIIAGL